MSGFPNDQSNGAGAIPVWIALPGGATASLGYEQITSLNTVKTFTVPAGARTALVVATGQGVRWRNDGTAPTGSVGMPIPINTPTYLSGDLTDYVFIEQTATAVLNVTYY